MTFPSGFTASSALGPNGGAAQVTSSVNVILTAASAKVQAVNITALGSGVVLPDATAIPLGGAIFIIQNTGNITFPVTNYTGGILIGLSPGQMALFFLTSGSTQAGTWAIESSSYGKQGSQPNFFAGPIDTIDPSTGLEIAITSLSSSQAILVYRPSTGYLMAVLLTVSGINIVAGTPITLTTGTNSGQAICTLSNTQAIVAYVGSTGFLNTYTLNIAAGVLSAGTPFIGSAVTISLLTITPISSTQALAMWLNSSTTFAEGRTLNVSGTTVSGGTTVSIASASPSDLAVVATSTTKGLFAAKYGSALAVFVVTISGTSISFGAQFSVGTINPGVTLTQLTPTSALGSYSSSSGLACSIFSISGTTVSATNTIVLTSVNTDVSVQKLCLTGPNNALLVYKTASPTNMTMAISIVISPSNVLSCSIPTQILNGTVPTYAAVCNAYPANSQAIFAYTDPSSSYTCATTITPII